MKLLWVGSNDGLWVYDGRRWSRVVPSAAFKQLVSRRDDYQTSGNERRYRA
jgi:ligand-binding sensor domain-containing protein